MGLNCALSTHYSHGKTSPLSAIYSFMSLFPQYDGLLMSGKAGPPGLAGLSYRHSEDQEECGVACHQVLLPGAVEATEDMLAVPRAGRAAAVVENMRLTKSRWQAAALPGSTEVLANLYERCKQPTFSASVQTMLCLFACYSGLYLTLTDCKPIYVPYLCSRL